MSRLKERGPFDGALSNFGVLNCVENLPQVAAALAPLMRKGAPLVLCVMGRFCLWETIWYLLHGRLEKALRRFRTAREENDSPGLDSGGSFPLYYRTASRVSAAFKEGFKLQSVRGVGVLVPPSYMEAWARRWPRLVHAFDRIDNRLGGWPILRTVADHQLLIFERTAEPARSRAAATADTLSIRCPCCRHEIGVLRTADFSCRSCAFRFESKDGVVAAIPPQRSGIYARFRKEYLAIRKDEGRGSDTPEYYRALPYEDLTNRNSDQWRIRARTYHYFERRLLPRYEQGRALKILDLGAGTGWFSYRMAKRGHLAVAVDLLTDPLDGLGAARHYQNDLGRPFPCFEAEFDNLPFSDSQFDISVFNASLHYSTDYKRTLEEVRRCLRPSGVLVIMDSPIYRRREQGEQMCAERHRDFKKKYGFRSDSIQSLEYLYDDLLDELARKLKIRWQVHRPWYGWRWHSRPLRARVKGGRHPSRFNILEGRWIG
jgi:ubiquinone/menaquinone biosynthesis C-methylase UbiE